MRSGGILEGFLNFFIVKQQKIEALVRLGGFCLTAIVV